MTTPSTIFLTGATGFIGRRVAERLAARGDRIRCLVRDPAGAGALVALGAEIVPGDLSDRAALSRGMTGAAAAIHLAAIYDVGVVDESALQRTNVDGTATFLDAAAEAGVGRVVYVSSTVALGPVPTGIGDEQSRNHGPFRSAYERTKTEAHVLALRAQDAGAPLIVVCPAYVYGPEDRGPGGRFLRDLVRRRVPGLLTRPAWFSFVYVDDVADGIMAALDRGATGSTYVLSGEDATINAFASKAAAAAGVGMPILRFPPLMAKVTGSLLDAVTRVTGLSFPITRENVETVAGHRWLHSHAKATAELAWHPRGLTEGLATTMAWVKSDAAAT